MIKYDNAAFDPSTCDWNDIDRLQIEMIPKHSRVLEIGCATGFMSEYLRREKDCFVFGIESNSSQAQMAVGRCDELLCGLIDTEEVQSTLDQFVRKSEKFDVVFMSQVIEHIACPNDIITKIRDWLTADGVLVISTVNVAHWKSRLRLLLGKWEYEKYGLFDDTHLRFFCVNGFEQDLKRLGYEIIDEAHSITDISPFFFIPKIRILTVTKVVRTFHWEKSKLYGWYCSFLRNLISNQFVFKAKKIES